MRCLEGDKLKNNNFRDKKRFGWIKKNTIKPLYRFKFEKWTSPHRLYGRKGFINDIYRYFSKNNFFGFFAIKNRKNWKYLIFLKVYSAGGGWTPPPAPPRLILYFDH